MEAAADLIQHPALHAGAVVVRVVELDLHHLDVRLFGEDLLQQGGLVVEGDADVPDAALRLQLPGHRESIAGAVFGIIYRVHGMHQVEVEVVHPAGLQLGEKQGPDLLLAFKKAVGELIRQQVALAGVAAGQAVAQGGFAFAVQVAVGGVEVAQARVHKIVHHAAGFFQVHITGRVGGGTGEGQAHKAEPQLFCSEQFFHGKVPPFALHSAFIIRRGRGLVNEKGCKKPLCRAAQGRMLSSEKERRLSRSSCPSAASCACRGSGCACGCAGSRG